MPKPVVREVYTLVGDGDHPDGWQDEAWHYEDVGDAIRAKQRCGTRFRVHSVKITMELGPVIEPPAPKKRKVKRG